MTSSNDTGQLVEFKFVYRYEDGTEQEQWPSAFWFSDKVDYSFRVSETRMPQKYIGKMATDFQWSEYREDTTALKSIVNAFVVKFEESFLAQHRGLYIYSETKGSGKTLLACCLGNEIAKRYGYKVKFATATDYLEAVKDKSDLKQQCKECDLLILDDFGVQDSKDWIVETFFGLINYRNTNMCSTIITSNVPRNHKSIEDRIRSRIHEMCLEIHLPEYSVRDKKTDEQEKAFINSLLA